VQRAIKKILDTYSLPSPASSPDGIEVLVDGRYFCRLQDIFEMSEHTRRDLYWNVKGDLFEERHIQILFKGVCVFDNQKTDNKDK